MSAACSKTTECALASTTVTAELQSASNCVLCDTGIADGVKYGVMEPVAE